MLVKGFPRVHGVKASPSPHHSLLVPGDSFNTLRPRQNGRHFADDNFRRIFLNENVRISIEISLKFFPNGRINSIPSLVQIMAWRRPGDKPLSEPMMVRLLTHICVARPQWVLITDFAWTSSEVKVWIRNYIHIKWWNAITDLYFYDVIGVRT